MRFKIQEISYSDKIMLNYCTGNIKSYDTIRKTKAYQQAINAMFFTKKSLIKKLEIRCFKTNKLIATILPDYFNTDKKRK